MCSQTVKHNVTIHFSDIQWFLPTTQTRKSNMKCSSVKRKRKVCRAERSKTPKQVSHTKVLGRSLGRRRKPSRDQLCRVKKTKNKLLSQSGNTLPNAEVPRSKATEEHSWLQTFNNTTGNNCSRSCQQWRFKNKKQVEDIQTPPLPPCAASVSLASCGSP